MKKKILIIANDSVGLHLFRSELIKKLSENSEVTALCPDTGFTEELTQIGCHFLSQKMERRGMNPIKDFELLLDYIRVIREKKPDLVITYTVKPNAYGGIACQMCGVPYAVNVTGLGTAFQGNGMLRKFVTGLYKIAFRRAKVVFFENEENRDIIVEAGIIGKDRTHVLHGAGVDLKKFSYIEYPKEDRITRFLFVGRVMKEKGVNELFEAMRRLRADGLDCTLDILGSFDEDYSEKIEAAKSEDWLTYYGYQPDVKPFIERCHCFVLPSWHEGMANTNLESAASGRPVITSNIHGCMEAVENGVTGFLCEKKNAEDLYCVMKKFAELPYEQRKAMGLAGRKRMEMIFDKKKVVEETISHL